MQGHEAIARSLHELGVRHLFGLMGRANMRFLLGARDLGIEYFGARHETAAVSMADAYARATGGLGVCTVTLGPGVTHCLTGLVEASRASTPMLLLAGDAATGAEHSGQYVDQAALCRTLGIRCIRLSRQESVVTGLRSAVAAAIRERCPVVVSVPVDVQSAPTDATGLGTDWTVEPASPVRADDSLFDAVATVLAGARRPVVLAGRGALGAGEALSLLADRCGALLATTLPAAGLFGEHPYAIGTIGVHGTAASAQLLAEADIVLAFGTSISPFTTCGGHLFPSVRTIVHCDVVATAHVSAPVALRLPGDAADVANALATVITRRDHAPAGYRTADVRSVIKAGRGPIDGDLGTPGQFVDPRRVLDWLDQRLPEARTVVPEPSHAAGYALEHLRVHQKRGGVSLFDFQSIGLGLAASVGAAVAHPGRITVSVVGDGGALMSLGELETMVRYRLPILVVVLNDAAYGAEARELQMRGLPIADATFPETDFAGTARALGASGGTVRDLAGLTPVAVWIDRPDGPFILDCRVDPRHPAAWFTAAIGRADGFLRKPRPEYARTADKNVRAT